MVFIQMPAEDVSRIGGRFLRDVRQAHVRLIHFSATLLVVAVRACRYDVRPYMCAAHVSRNDVIYC